MKQYKSIFFGKRFYQRESYLKYSRLEWDLMSNLLKYKAGNSLLDIGCGSGLLSLELSKRGFWVTGIDSSSYLIDSAKKNSNKLVDFYIGVATNLPFEDNSFNHACLFHTLEFVDDCSKVIEEACRVAKDSVFIGVLNRYSIKSIIQKADCFLNYSNDTHARLFSVWELKTIVQDNIGSVSVAWRTIGDFLKTACPIVDKFGKTNLLKRFPFGSFIGMLIYLTPSDIVMPMDLECSGEEWEEVVAT